MTVCSIYHFASVLGADRTAKYAIHYGPPQLPSDFDHAGCFDVDGLVRSGPGYD